MFIDRVKVRVAGGDGGNGCISFSHERHQPKGGPDGGDGGDGGNVYFISDPSINTLLELHARPQYRAQRGQHGRGKTQHGRRGRDIICRVPVGTIIYEANSGKQLFDLNKPNMQVIVARGGKGGRGNARFASPTTRAPRLAEPGQPGEERLIIAELKMIADVGLVGVPNAGKSTLINALSNAHSRTAAYPFTTLHPVLGTIITAEHDHIVVADIPGLIEGAHKGAGLGQEFLRHIERTWIIIYVLDITGATGAPPEITYDKLRYELQTYDEKLLQKRALICLNKIDLCSESEVQQAVSRFRSAHPELLAEDLIEISALRRINLEKLLERIKALYRQEVKKVSNGDPN